MGLNQQDVDFRFCPVCGGRLETSKPKESEPSRLVCSDCHYIFYLDPKVVACAILEKEGKILLLRRAIHPRKGKWVMPGGYVDRGEEVHAAAIRETEEECGLKIHLQDLVGVYSYPGRLAVVVVYEGRYLSGEPIAGDESLEAMWFSHDRIPWDDLAFQSTKDALKDYCKKIKKNIL
ncbi:MAG: NUDIX hydrolase [Deltaproteobacteria bacterium]|nr:NUDIX hydrolase [Deltaproteobacteria bacterium]